MIVITLIWGVKTCLSAFTLLYAILSFQYAEAKQAELETNLFEVETAMKAQDITEGQSIILDFLRKCKQVQETTSSDDEMMRKINDFKQDLLKQNNKYVKSLIA